MNLTKHKEILKCVRIVASVKGEKMSFIGWHHIYFFLSLSGNYSFAAASSPLLFSMIMEATQTVHLNCSSIDWCTKESTVYSQWIKSFPDENNVPKLVIRVIKFNAKLSFHFFQFEWAFYKYVPLGTVGKFVFNTSRIFKYIQCSFFMNWQTIWYSVAFK